MKSPNYAFARPWAAPARAKTQRPAAQRERYTALSKRAVADEHEGSSS